MGWLVNLVIGWGVPAKAGKVVAFGLIALFVVLAMWGGRCAYDAAVIDRHDTKVELEQSKADRKADEKAAIQRRTDDARIVQEEQELKNVLQQNGVDPATRRRDFYRCVRLQQAARANGLEPPACV